MELTLNSLILDAKIAIVSSIDASGFIYPKPKSFKNSFDKWKDGGFFKDFNMRLHSKYSPFSSYSSIHTKLSDTIWFTMMMIDEDFAEFAKSDLGIRTFIRLYSVIIHSAKGEYLTYLCGKLHSFDGKHAAVCCGLSMSASLGIIHRDDDEPAIVMPNCEYWFKNDRIHRIGGAAWYHRYPFEMRYYHMGSLQSEDGLPSVVVDDRKEWHNNGILYKESVRMPNDVWQTYAIIMGNRVLISG